MTKVKGSRRRLLTAAGLCVLLLATLAAWGCSSKPAEVVELKRFALDNLDGVLTRSDVALDTAVSSDGKGSLRVTVTQPIIVRLFEVEGLNVEQARLIYRAKLRTENLDGQVFLEMWVRFPGKGEYFSRDINSPLSKTTDWTSMETPFFLQKGEKPDLIKLNVVVQGKGVVWVDDIVLLKAGL